MSYLIWLKQKKLCHHFPVTQLLQFSQATRRSTCGGPVAFRPTITRGLALARIEFIYSLNYFNK
jgi:hypothetical protein